LGEVSAAILELGMGFFTPSLLDIVAESQTMGERCTFVEMMNTYIYDYTFEE
jgi:hypothetical protein